MTAALLVVDVQNGFVNESSQHIVEPIARCLHQWLSVGRPAVLTRFINTKGSKWETLIHWGRLQASPETDFSPAIQRVVDGYAPANNLLVVNKTIYSSMSDLVWRFLESRQIADIYVCGISTDGCVLKTVVDIFEFGNYKPYLLTDLSASHAGNEIHQAGLLLAGRFIGIDQLVTSGALP